MPALTAAVRALALGGLLLPAAAWADHCTATLSQSMIDFGEINVLQSAGGVINIPVKAKITCTTSNLFLPRRFYVCLAADSGRWAYPGSVNGAERYLCTEPQRCHSSSTRMSYNLYADSGGSRVWGNTVPSRGTADTLNTVIDIPRGFSSAKSASAELVFYAQMKLPQHAELPPGVYQNLFTAGSTALLWNRNAYAEDCGGYTADDERIPFRVQAVVVKHCRVQADALDFGSVPASRSHIPGQTRLRVICTRDTPYTVGLQSDHTLGEGQGAMQPLAGSGTAVPYTLHRSSPPKENNLWGYAPRLRAAGQGEGKTQSYTVFGSVPSADYRPGQYQDTVRIEVAY